MSNTSMPSGTCACRKLHPAILMVKPAEDGLSSELAEPLHLSTARRSLPQGQMRSQFVVVAGVAGKDPAQMVCLLKSRNRRASSIYCTTTIPSWA
jgi:hypothetical protein